MKFVADESVDYGIVKELRKNGIVIYSIQENDSGVDDIEVLTDHGLRIKKQSIDINHLNHRN